MAKRPTIKRVNDLAPSRDSLGEVREADEVIDASPSDDPALQFDSLEDAVQHADLINTEETSNLPAVSGSDLVRYDPLQSYLQEIRHIPTLSREEEHELAVKYKATGDRKIALKLVMANLRLVVMIAREHQRNVQNILDLVQEGNIGLLEAVEKYDPFRGIRFPSYAVFWVRAYILRYLINNVRLVKVGTTQAQRKLFFNLIKEKDRLEKEGFVPEAKLLADRLDVKESEVLEMQQRLQLPDLSVDAPLRKGGEEGGDLHSIIPSGIGTIEDEVVSREFQDKIRGIVEEYKINADEKERAIIELRLLTEEPMTLQEIADKFGISRERIRQIETRLKDRLKERLSGSLDLNSEGHVDPIFYEAKKA